MFHPLLRLLASQPELVAEHLAGYAALAQAEADQARRGFQARLGLMVLAGLGLLLGLGLAGAALLLLGAVPLGQMPWPWLLWLVPLLPSLAGLACLVAAQRIPTHDMLDRLRAQWREDLALLRDAGEQGQAR